MGVMRGTANESVNIERTAENMLTKILDGRLHLRHADNIRNDTLGSNNTAQCIRVFLSKLFEQYDYEL
jgi:hypothetical protein